MDGLDPTAMEEAAVMLHEMFVSLKAAGFTDFQACMICAGMISNNGNTKDEGSGG